MSKKRGFTLVEILVVVAITTLVLAMVGGLLIFMAETSGTLIHKSEELMLVQSIESYLRGVYENEGTANLLNGNIKLQEGNIKNGENVIFKDTGLSQNNGFLIYRETGYGNREFIRCKLVFEPNGRTKGNHTYDFIIGINNDINYGG